MGEFSFAIGQRVAGIYEIVSFLSSGDRVLIFTARHIEFADRLVVLKILHPDFVHDQELVTRFCNEVMATYQVNHPHVVRAYECFRDHEYLGYSMEYLAGGDLADLIRSKQRLDLLTALNYIRDIASGLSAVHAAGVVHRDIKPENVLLDSHAKVKITDFGIAHSLDRQGRYDNEVIVGTLDYLSPEYLEKGILDVRSDIYALGVLAYELITGFLPFKCDDLLDVVKLRLTTTPKPPSFYVPECEGLVDKVVLKALERNPLLRYQNTNDFLLDLERVFMLLDEPDGVDKVKVNE